MCIFVCFERSVHYFSYVVFLLVYFSGGGPPATVWNIATVVLVLMWGLGDMITAYLIWRLNKFAWIFGVIFGLMMLISMIDTLFGIIVLYFLLIDKGVKKARTGN